MPNEATPKYSIVEIERRWLVDLAAIGDLSSTPSREIEDLYISGSRLRLRRITGPDGATIFKFGKKYGKCARSSEPVTNLYLTDSEYRQLSTLSGAVAVKRRYSLAGGALDIYERPVEGLAVFEVEFDSEVSAEAFCPPLFVTREITAEWSFSGFSIAENRFCAA